MDNFVAEVGAPTGIPKTRFFVIKDSTIGIYLSRQCTFVYISATFSKIARYMWCRTNEAIHWLLLLKG